MAESANGADGRRGHSDYVQSLERGLSVLRAFGPERTGLTLSDVARITGLTRAAARRFLLTLVELGYVTSDRRVFSLSPRVLELGYGYLSGLGLTDMATPHMEELVAAVKESSSIAVLDGDDIVYVVRVPTKRIMTVSITLGTRFPAYCTSMGRVLLAALDEDALGAYLARVQLAPLTHRTVTEKARLAAIVAETRVRGFSLVDQELEDGLRSVAVPIVDARGVTVAAVNVSAHSSRVSLDELRTKHLARLQETARRINADLEAVERRGGPAPAALMAGDLETQVGIVGAGPAGLVLSQLLHLEGIDSVVLEQRSRDHVETRIRAGVLEQGSTDLLIEAGVGERLLAEGAVHEGVNLQFDGRAPPDRLHRAHRAPHHRLRPAGGGEGPHRGAARGRRDHPVRGARRRARPASTTERPTIAFTHGGAGHELACSVVAGCDGFHGVCRAAIPAGGAVGVRARVPVRVARASWPRSRRRPTSSSTPSSDRGFASAQPALPRALPPLPPGRPARRPRQLARRRGSGRSCSSGSPRRAGPSPKGRSSRRRITAMRSYVCEPMQHGNLFLAGDAAHIVPPTGAKGMNLAIADVTVLARALADWFHRSDRAGLDAYSARVPREGVAGPGLLQHHDRAPAPAAGGEPFGGAGPAGPAALRRDLGARCAGPSPRTTWGCRSLTCRAPPAWSARGAQAVAPPTGGCRPGSRRSCRRPSSCRATSPSSSRLDPPGVAPADVEVVEEEQRVELGDRLADPGVPAVVADVLAGPLAQLLVVGLALAERLVGDLEVREEGAVEEQRGAEPGAEGDDELEALALDHRRALDVRVVGDLGRLAERVA